MGADMGGETKTPLWTEMRLKFHTRYETSVGMDFFRFIGCLSGRGKIRPRPTSLPCLIKPNF